MRTPFFLPALGLTCGIFLGGFGWHASGILLHGGSLLVLSALWLGRGRKYFDLLFTGFALLLGLTLYANALSRPPNAVEKFASAEEVNLSGEVVSIPEERVSGGRNRTSFVLAADEILHLSPAGRSRISVKGRVQVYLYNPGSEIRYGDRILTHGLLKQTEPNLNPDSFDLRSYLQTRNIYCTFRAYGFDPIKLEAPRHFFPVGNLLINRVRRETQSRIGRLWQNDSRQYFEALILGTRQGISAELYRDFAVTGTAHLLSISGLHLVLITGGIMGILAACGWERKEAAIAGMVSAMIFAVIGGLSIPLVRSAGMACAALFGVVFERGKSALNIFFLTYTLFLCLNPFLLWNVSFQLSFMSVLMLILPGENWPLNGYATLRQCLAATAGTFPLVLYHFQIFSIVSPAANLASIPFFNAGLASAFAAMALEDVPGAGFVLARSAEGFMKSCFSIVSWFAKIPCSHFFLTKPSPNHLGIYYFWLATYFLCQTGAGKCLEIFRRVCAGGLILTAAIFFVPQGEDRFVLNLFETQEGLLSHVSFPGNKNWLISSGSSRSLSREIEDKVIPYVRRWGMRKTEGVILDRLGKGRGFQRLTELTRPDFVLTGSVPLSLSIRQIRGGDKVRLQTGSLLEIIFVSPRGELCFQIERQGRRILFIPAGVIGLERVLSSRTNLKKPWLAVIYESREPGIDILPLIKWLEPLQVVLCGPPGRETEFLSRARIPWRSTELHGAIRIQETSKNR